MPSIVFSYIPSCVPNVRTAVVVVVVAFSVVVVVDAVVSVVVVVFLQVIVLVLHVIQPSTRSTTAHSSSRSPKPTHIPVRLMPKPLPSLIKRLFV